MSKPSMDFVDYGLKKLSGRPTFKEEGESWEGTVKRHLKKNGYKVMEKENIHHDLRATKGGKTYIIECKRNKANFSQDELVESHRAVQKGYIYLIARSDDIGRVELFNPSNLKKYKQQKKEARDKKRKKLKASSANMFSPKMPKIDFGF